MRNTSLAVVLSFCLLGCGEPADDSTGTTGSPQQTQTPGDGNENRKERPKKDRGQASMDIGSVAWLATRAKAKLRDGRLTIRASRTEMQDGKVSREELNLQINDFKGPGEYTVAPIGSRFLGVDIDMPSDKSGEPATGGPNETATDTVTDALRKAKHMMLSGARVTITAASDTQISGTFSWQPPAGMDRPSLNNGIFRALIN